MSTSTITRQLIEKALNYSTYRQHIIDLLANDKTTGSNHSLAMIEYTKMNIQRMKRWDKTLVLSKAILDKTPLINKRWTWLVLVEAWCGDVAQNLPVWAMIADLSPNIDLRLILRDENLDIMDQHLTNGGRSIPKLICLNTETLAVLGTWGPRPAPVQDMLLAYKKNPSESYADLAKKMHTWYAKDKAQTLQNEIQHLITTWESKN